MFKAEAWESKEKCVLSGRHELITDEYYDWYVNHDCTHGTLLHFCSGRVGQCRTRLEPGDQRELVHVGKWRQLTPALCLRQAYTQKLGVEMGLEALKRAAANAEKAIPRDPVRGTGVDKALEELRREPMHERGRDMERRKDHGSPPAGRKKKPEKKSVVEIMQQRAESRARSDKEEEEKKKRKKKKKDKARKKRKSLEDSSSSSSGSSNSSSQPDFRSSSARGGELWRLLKRSPGVSLN